MAHNYPNKSRFQVDVWSTQREGKVEPTKTLYKVTDNFWEADSLRWGNHVTHVSSGNNFKNSWVPINSLSSAILAAKGKTNVRLHAYTHPVMAALLFPAHTDIRHPVMWRCSGQVKKMTIDKVALCERLTSEEIVPNVVLSHYTRMYFGFGCVSKVYRNVEYRNWYYDWITKRDYDQERARYVVQKCEKDYYSRYGLNHRVSPEGLGLRAALWMAWAAVAFSDRNIDESGHLCEMYPALAAVEANLAARELGVQFDLLAIAEIVMEAK